MCKNVTTIKFCTCSKKKKISTEFPDELHGWYLANKLDSFTAIDNGTYEETYYKWTLQSFKKDRPHAVMGSISYPKDMLSKELTKDSVLQLLNNGSCFDFKYTPKEKDYLLISELYKYIRLDEHERPFFSNYMEFKYENNEWVFGGHPMGYTFKDIKKGKVKVKKK